MNVTNVVAEAVQEFLGCSYKHKYSVCYVEDYSICGGIYDGLGGDRHVVSVKCNSADFKYIHAALIMKDEYMGVKVNIVGIY